MINMNGKGKPVWRMNPFSAKAGSTPVFRKAGTQSHRVCPQIAWLPDGDGRQLFLLDPQAALKINPLDTGRNVNRFLTCFEWA